MYGRGLVQSVPHHGPLFPTAASPFLPVPWTRAIARTGPAARAGPVQDLLAVRALLQASDTPGRGPGHINDGTEGTVRPSPQQEGEGSLAQRLAANRRGRRDGSLPGGRPLAAAGRSRRVAKRAGGARLAGIYSPPSRRRGQTTNYYDESNLLSRDLQSESPDRRGSQGRSNRAIRGSINPGGSRSKCTGASLVRARTGRPAFPRRRAMRREAAGRRVSRGPRERAGPGVGPRVPGRLVARALRAGPCKRGARALGPRVRVRTAGTGRWWHGPHRDQGTFKRRARQAGRARTNEGPAQMKGVVRRARTDGACRLASPGGVLGAALHVGGRLGGGGVPVDREGPPPKKSVFSVLRLNH